MVWKEAQSPSLSLSNRRHHVHEGFEHEASVVIPRKGYLTLHAGQILCVFIGLTGDLTGGEISVVVTGHNS